MNEKLKDHQTDLLFRAILSLESIEECYNFFEDLCTVSEIKAMAQRMRVAQMIRDDRLYNEIEKETGASSATISRVKRCLNYGADGYLNALAKLREQDE